MSCSGQARRAMALGLRAALAATLLAGVTGCDETPVSPSAVRGMTWELVSFERLGEPPIRIEEPQRYTLRFDEDGRVTIRSDCNRCTGGYRVQGSSWSIQALACTRAFCGTASLDDRFTQALNGVQSIVGTESALVARGPDVVLRFQR